MKLNFTLCMITQFQIDTCTLSIFILVTTQALNLFSNLITLLLGWLSLVVETFPSNTNLTLQIKVT